MVKKKKLWRKALDDSQYTKAAVDALKARSASTVLYTHDTLGENTAPEPIYPEKFAREKFLQSISRSDHFKIKNLPIKRPRADNSEIFDMWSGDGKGVAGQISHIPAVINPHPGQSYRPDKLYHEDILDRVVQEEQVKQNDSEKHVEVINSYRVIDEDHTPEESEDETPAEFIRNPKVVEKYMTNTQKNIKKRNQLKEKLKKIMASERKTQKQLDKIPQINQELERLDRKYTKLRGEKEIQKKIKVELEITGEIVPRIRMGKFRYKKPETQASIQLSDNLRRLEVKGNNVEERMDSFIRRKMVDMSKSKDKKQFVIKDCSNNEKAIEFQLSRLKKQQEKDSGKISLSK